MKTMLRAACLLLFLFCSSYSASAQILDTATIRLEVDSLLLECRSLYKENKTERAEAVIALAKEKTEQVFGKEHELYAACLYRQGYMYFYQDKLVQAKPYWLKAKDIRAKTIGTETKEYAISLLNLGIVCKNLSEFDEAEMYYLETKGIRERLFGKEHSRYLTCLHNMGTLYQASRDYEKAESIFIEAIEIGRTVLGNDSPKLADSMHNLADIYKHFGEYKKAERLGMEAKNIWEKAYGKEHADYGWGAHGLANLYLEIGQYEKAENLYNETIAIWEKTLGKEHNYYLMANSNLARLYNSTGLYEKAISIYTNVSTIRKQLLGTENSSYANSINNLAFSYQNIDNYDKAKALFIEAKDIWEKINGKEHEQYALSLANLGGVLEDQNQFAEAEKRYKEAKNIRAKTLGERHPRYAASLSNLGALHFRSNEFDKAAIFYEEYYKKIKTSIQEGLSFLSEREQDLFLSNNVRKPIQKIQSLGLHVQSPAYQKMQYDICLLLKGLQLTASQNTLEYIYQSENEAAIKAYKDLMNIRNSLANEYKKSVSKRVGVSDLENKETEKEKELARLSSRFRQEQKTNKISVENIQSALQSNEAALEFMHFNYAHPESTDSVLYVALLLLPNEKAPHFIPLFEEKEMNVLFEKERKKGNLINKLYTSRGLTPDKKKLNEQALYPLIWEKINPFLKGINTIYYAPSGLLHRINLAAIPLDKEQVLSDKYRLYQLSSTRQVVLKKENFSIHTAEALVLGGIDYELNPTISFEKDSMEIAAVDELGFNNLSRNLAEQGESWKYLPGTAKETQLVSKTLQEAGFDCQYLSGTSASEEQLKTICSQDSSPSILHIATHGYFFPDPNEFVDTPKNTQQIYKISNHPMIRSGLILAGGNLAWQGKASPEMQEDGILTAYEISQLNLRNTALVVLSACETGLGDIKGNEGVFGLQRAFKIAGAQYLIMSLWQVPDEATQRLMTIFYNNCLLQKMEIRAAFDAAQKTIRDDYENPYFWAGFILME